VPFVFGGLASVPFVFELLLPAVLVFELPGVLSAKMALTPLIAFVL